MKIMEEAAELATDLLKALAAKNRLMILWQLTEGRKSVGELANRLGLRDASVSQHLALLRREDLVRPRREAQKIYYSLSGIEVRRIIEVLYEIYYASTEGELVQGEVEQNRQATSKVSGS